MIRFRSPIARFRLRVQMPWYRVVPFEPMSPEIAAFWLETMQASRANIARLAALDLAEADLIKASADAVLHIPPGRHLVTEPDWLKVQRAPD